VTGDCFDFDPKIKNRKCWDFFKKSKMIKDFFFGPLTKKNIFFMKRTTSQAVVPPGVRQEKKTSRDRSDWGLF
jgi:hypothetical protein